MKISKRVQILTADQKWQSKTAKAFQLLDHPVGPGLFSKECWNRIANVLENMCLSNPKIQQGTRYT